MQKGSLRRDSGENIRLEPLYKAEQRESTDVEEARTPLKHSTRKTCDSGMYVACLKGKK